ncbi:MAG: TIR domain-containing protein [Cyanobacteria bacterium P01_G01_bin.39]
MKRTFGEFLKHFVLSVDIVDGHTKNAILEQIKLYLDEELGIVYITFLTETLINGQAGLSTTEWYIGGNKSAFTLKNDQGHYSSQVTMSYDLEKPLWIVGENNDTLNHTNKYVDLWSKVDSQIIPSYNQAADRSSLKTSIIIPVYNDKKRKFGVINFESTRFVEPSKPIKDELKRIVRCISKLYFRNQTFTEQGKDTREAIQDLINMRAVNLATLSKPKVFLASPYKCESDVISEIKDIVNKHDKFELVYWADISNAGFINTDILKEIQSCKFGVCYFSEKDEAQENHYFDNHNVLIEAGMFLAKSENFDNVIPIREENSQGKVAFDIYSLRTIRVTRNQVDNSINLEDFRMLLNGMLADFSKSI